jgi:hypothetical protein
MRRSAISIAGAAPALLIALSMGACQAEQETLDQGVRLDAPPQVEQAPATPISPQAAPPMDTTGALQDTTLGDTAAAAPR